MKLPPRCLMVITDRHRCRMPLIQAIHQAVEAGVDAVQLREKDLDATELYQLGLRLREITKGRCLLLVNDRIDVALAVAADGIHLPERGLPIESARRLTPVGFLIGRSVHSTIAAQQAEASGADYVELGTIFPTASKPGAPPAGVSAIRAATGVLRIPCLAIGGIDSSNSCDALRAGASGVAVVGGILGAPDIRTAVQELRETLERD